MGSHLDNSGSHQPCCPNDDSVSPDHVLPGEPMSAQLARAVVGIREMILRGRLAPGQRVAEAPLAVSLGMSRTPVRQALPLLAQEGLLAVHETRGYVVRSFTGADIADAIDVRAVLEGLAARRIAERGASKTFLRELRACLDDGDAIFRKRRLEESDEGAYAEMNTRFHALILAEAASPILVEALERGQSGRVEALMREHAGVVKDSLNVASLPVARAEAGPLARAV